ncbi:PREDICTED: uncharacterized protein LOC107186316 [Dufourea novaeangliae]|uniref:CHK kinase-like domain-containing protein n=1 Tax=Dufourea novaeangliae TaxID=178035 RepID=A0A154P828_DUFNO|nr:PREDICTED: uncharacterized protein LOC107186316 [Dufourea novaeangliae]XP_015429642.1 PREDICTED: uncharacterized protein LOC107186316 [Dufourea novaeangliae]XP_015429643.1 PREDICTED: uncharacterized protein LOC107186316 [Dufourea novaeangliae]XP_015429644.1 PREDICTED: uncharacterized protein LOC107186316 [Dufourea novaeangliae]KZC08001.1 hypothetical protein WN55_09064 [Dufourea novaeangliae]
MTPSVERPSIQDLEALLAESLGADFQIKSLEWKPLTAPGENFGSVMLAMNVTLTRANRTETLNLVAKLPPTSAYLLELFNSPVTFRKELKFYSIMTREFEKLQLESGVKKQDICVLAPKFYGGRLGLCDPEKFDEHAVIILENLKYNGYDTQDRIHGLDRKHTDFALEELAKLHAHTVALKLKKPEIFREIVSEVLTEVLNDTTEKCVIDMVRKAEADLKEIEEAKPYLDRVSRTIEFGIQLNKNSRKPEEPWATLVHNDFWVNNMMFRHDARGELIGMKIVDFQLCLYDHGVYDLLFFLVSSVKKDVLDHKLSDMIDYYYRCFIKSLKTLKVDTEKFTKRSFDELVNYCGPAKFNQCLMMAQVIQAPKESAPEMKDLKGDMFLNRGVDDVYREKLLQIVKLFDERGWLIE